MRSQAGFALLEVVIAVGLTAVATGALLLAIVTFSRFGSHAAGPNRSAAIEAAEQMLRVAEDAWKYGSPGTAPAGTVQIMAPLTPPGAAPTTIPLTISTTLSGAGATGAGLTVTVSYPPDPNRSDPGIVTMSGRLAIEAPLPGSHVPRGGLVPMPDGAP